MLSQKHLDAMSDDDHFDVAEAVKRVHPSPPPLLVLADSLHRAVPLVPLMSKEAALGLEKEWTDNSGIPFPSLFLSVRTEMITLYQSTMTSLCNLL